VENDSLAFTDEDLGEAAELIFPLCCPSQVNFLLH
jgi:hypothetical protein